MFAYSVVFFSSSAYLFYHRWKYLSTHFLQRASVFRTIPVASFVFVCRKHLLRQSKKKNGSTKNERSNLIRLLRSISIKFLICRWLTIYCFFGHLFVFRELNKTTFLVKAPSQIIMTSVYVTRSARTRHKIMSIGGFDNLSAEFALDSILDDLLHTITSIANTIPQRFQKV